MMSVLQVREARLPALPKRDAGELAGLARLLLTFSVEVAPCVLVRLH